MNKAKDIFSNLKKLEQIINLMHKANKAIIEIYKKSNIKVESKSNQTPVTQADLAANKILTDGLMKLFPLIPIVSEEDENSFNNSKKLSTFWLIDPLDGTKEFINKRDEFTCNLALIEDSSPTLGFVSVPVKELIYYGGKEFGSKVINYEKKISEIKCRAFPGICRVVASKSHLNEDTKKFISDIQEKVELIQAGSSLKFLKIAEGKADLYPRLGPTSEWDTAAAHAILEGAGGRVRQVNGEKLIYGKKDILNPYFIANGEDN